MQYEEAYSSVTDILTIVEKGIGLGVLFITHVSPTACRYIN